MKRLFMLLAFAVIASASPSVRVINFNGPLLAFLQQYFGVEVLPYAEVFIEDIPGASAAYSVTIDGANKLCEAGVILLNTGLSLTVCLIPGNFPDGAQVTVVPLVAMPTITSAIN